MNNNAQKNSLLVVKILSSFILLTPLVSNAFSIDTLWNTSTGLITCNNTTASPCDFNALMLLVNHVIDFLIIMAAPITAIVFTWAGFQYLFSGGEGATESAKSMMVKTFWGFVIMLCAWLIVKTILFWLVDPRVYSGLFGA